MQWRARWSVLGAVLHLPLDQLGPSLSFVLFSTGESCEVVLFLVLMQVEILCRFS